MANLFEIKQSNLKDLQKFYKRSPRLFTKSAAYTINDQAFSARAESLSEIQKSMVIRSPGFVRSSVQVTKTRITDINRLQAVYGSVERENFTGWEEQELGKRSELKRRVTKAGRGGSYQNVAKGRARLKPNQNFINPRDLVKGKYKNKKHQQIIFLNMLRRMKYNKSFIMPNNMLVKKGLYYFESGKLKMYQAFDRPVRPKRNQWMTRGNEISAKKNPMDKLWARNLDKILPKKL